MAGLRRLQGGLQRTETLFPAPVCQNYGAIVAPDKSQPVGFMLPLALKDNGLLLEPAEQAGVPMPLVSVPLLQEQAWENALQ